MLVQCIYILVVAVARHFFLLVLLLRFHFELNFILRIARARLHCIENEYITIECNTIPLNAWAFRWYRKTCSFSLFLFSYFLLPLFWSFKPNAIAVHRKWLNAHEQRKDNQFERWNTKVQWNWLNENQEKYRGIKRKQKFWTNTNKWWISNTRIQCSMVNRY